MSERVAIPVCPHIRPFARCYSPDKGCTILFPMMRPPRSIAAFSGHSSVPDPKRILGLSLPGAEGTSGFKEQHRRTGGSTILLHPSGRIVNYFNRSEEH